MDFLIGVGMAVLFAGLNVYAYITKDFNYDSQYYMQLAVSGGAAFYLLGVQKWDTIKEWFTKKSTNDEAKEFSLDDFKALNYLRGRCYDINSEEALRLVVELNDLLFQGCGKDKMDIPVETVAGPNNSRKAKT